MDLNYRRQIPACLLDVALHQLPDASILYVPTAANASVQTVGNDSRAHRASPSRRADKEMLAREIRLCRGQRVCLWVSAFRSPDCLLQKQTAKVFATCLYQVGEVWAVVAVLDVL